MTEDNLILNGNDTNPVVAEIISSKLSVDFTNQFNQAKLLENGNETIFSTMKSISDQGHSASKRAGLLLVFGIFDIEDGIVSGVAQMGSNPIVNYTSIFDDDFESFLIDKMSKEDGAILINRTGQIIGGRVYLEVMHPDIAQEDEHGTRHRAAASFSMRKDVISIFTLSEQTLKLRRWAGGKVVETYDPTQIEPKPKRRPGKSKATTQNLIASE